MKRLVFLVLLCGLACAKEKPKDVVSVSSGKGSITVSPSVSVGDIWKDTFSGTRYKVVEVTDKHVIYEYADGTNKTPQVDTLDEFLEDMTQVGGTLLLTDDCTLTFAPEKKRYRFAGTITFGGEVELENANYWIAFPPNAFYDWINKMTVEQFLKDYGGMQLTLFKEIERTGK